MSTKIKDALVSLFEKKRIVFWYDQSGEMESTFRNVSIPKVQKIEIVNNEFGTKYTILREQPTVPFLLYFKSGRPRDAENWLLDVLLTEEEFRTDPISIILSEIGLGIEFYDLAREHSEFFSSEKRREKLKERITLQDSPTSIRSKMLGVIVGVDDNNISSIVLALLSEKEGAETKGMKAIGRSKLSNYFWKLVADDYGYRSNNPSVEDFAYSVFKAAYRSHLNIEHELKTDALVFIKNWKDSRTNTESFEVFSEKVAHDLDFETDLHKYDFRKLLKIDLFYLTDQKILSDLARDLVSKTVSVDDVTEICRQRRSSYWYVKDDKLRHCYSALENAAKFIHALATTDVAVTNFDDGMIKYTGVWYKVDQLYRKYIYHSKASGMVTLLSALTELVERKYTNTFVLKLNQNWQLVVDSLKAWKAEKVDRQDKFFEKYISPSINSGKKIFVIISDALRYEVGQELYSEVLMEDRFSADIQSLYSLLPSYTQMGMAALLPHNQLEFLEADSGVIKADGVRTDGIQNRIKILQSRVPKSMAYKTEDFFSLSGDQAREVIKANDLLYIYHNQIDSVGDKPESESKTFEAAETTISELIKLIRKLTSANANNVVITSDHGFLYQDDDLHESDFINEDPSVDQLWFRNRRFVFGTTIKPSPSFRVFSSSEMGLGGNIDIAIPKGVARLRVKGSGARFVHGGASLQEIAVPVILVNKKRESDLTLVEIDILQGCTRTISTGQVTVAFYQTEPVSEKLRPRKMRSGIYTKTNELVSERHDISFDSESPNPRDREVVRTFNLTRAAEKANNQEVELRLEELIENTNHYKTYKVVQYIVRRSFTTDFDF